jgi:hypothetical protein
VRQSIANYTTSIEAEKTVAQITKLLAAAKAEAILSQYKDGAIMAISFRIETEFGLLTFRLPANVEGIHAILLRSTKIPRSLRNMAQARRVAWCIVLHWLDAQLALIAAGLVNFEQVFLPYAQDANGVTVYEKLRLSRFNGYMLPEN